MKILIVAYMFPPVNDIASWRVYSWAKYWSMLGHQISVLKITDPFSRLPLTDFDTGCLKDVEVKEVDYGVFGLRKNDESGKLAESDKKEINTGVLNAAWRFLAKLREKAGITLNIADVLSWYSVREAIKFNKQMSFDVVVSTCPPIACHIAAGTLKRRFKNIFWVADYRDVWWLAGTFSGRKLFSRLEQCIDHLAMSRADLITTVSGPLRRQLGARYGDDKVITVYNGFDPEDAPEKDHQIFSRDGKIRLAYTGKIAGKRNPVPLFEAIASLKMKHMDLSDRLEVLFYTDQAERLSKFIRDYDIGDIVKALEFVGRKKSLQIQGEVDVLIFLAWDDKSAEGILSGKIFDYMNSGTPVLCIGEEGPDSAAEFIKNAGIGISCGNSVTLITDAIARVLNREKIPYSPDRSLMSNFTRKVQAESMLDGIIRRIKAS